MQKFILPILLFSTLSIAQEKTGVNTTAPKATLEVASATQNTTSDVEGLLIPRVSKQKALLMTQNTATPLEESTLIYINDLTFTDPADGTEVTVADISENGYYHWNGTQWVKQSGKDGDLWVKRDNNGEEQAYLKPALAQNDTIMYRGNKNFTINLGEVTREDTKTFSKNDGSYAFSPGTSAIDLVSSSDALPMISTVFQGENSENPGYYFNNIFSILKDDHVKNASNGKIKFYFGKSNTLNAIDIKSPIQFMSSSINRVSHLSNSLVKNLTGAETWSVAGSEDGFYKPTVYVNKAHVFNIKNYGTSSHMYGIDIINRNYGVSDQIIGIRNNIKTQEPINGIVAQHSTERVFGINNEVYVSKNGTNTKGVYGVKNFLKLADNSTTEAALRGFQNDIVLSEGSNAVEAKGILTYIDANENSTITETVRTLDTRYIGKSGSSVIEYNGIHNEFELLDGANVTDFYGYRQRLFVANTANVTNAYGLHLQDVNFASDSNYSIYTGIGQVSFGDNVVVRGGSSTVTAGSFNSTSGTFPDYVFQNYYNGESSINTDYNFKSLSEVEVYIKENGHLPGYVSAEEVAEAGQFNMTTTQLTNVEKIEELYLHTIEQDKELQEKDAKIKALENRLEKLEKLLLK